MKKLLVVLGPTASGKTQYAVQIANQFDGEIISADSRQIYKGMDIGTGKDLDEYNINDHPIPYHLIDIINPDTNYSVYDFKKEFHAIYDDIIARDKVPILCGGTALYIDSILFDYNIAPSAPNSLLREELDNYNYNDLKNKLLEINSSEYNPEYHISKRRLIRSIEILSYNKQAINMNLQGDEKFTNSLVIGMHIDRKKLLKKIKNRLIRRLKTGMIDEVEKLLNNGVSAQRLYSLGLEYRFISDYLIGKVNYDVMIDKLNIAINQFSKRQMTFFRRMEKRGITIHWLAENKKNIFMSNIKEYLQ
ncbi:MAG: tRNA (adenosine(37)-N6)-dimethylallyltransferase MiaA [Candidatus Marinimicrobia bacterium]|nr:tRNA (adenosine(37)-N6)-dimethylallyltransferase MiaA [Candidatus Neomarinimicrobiota bacterium]|tara:strand:- start:7048 stop:7962 length:915 start_codon:yes stop_codon:yes gene_type:complete